MQIDFEKLGKMLLPTFLRGGAIAAFIKVLSTPFTYLQKLFRSNREENLFDVKHNGQACYLKAALNDLYSLKMNGFEIEDNNPDGDWVILYDEAEALVNDHTIIYDETSTESCTIYPESLITQATHSFTVICPAVAWDTENNRPNYDVMRMVEKYRLASRTATYKLKTA